MPVESETPEEYRVWMAPPTDQHGRPWTYERRVLVTPAGDTLVVFVGVERQPDGRVKIIDGPCQVIGVESHFSTCPASEQFRR